MAKVFAFLAEGLEEVECLAVVDVLRRAGVETRLVSVTGNRMVTGSHNGHGGRKILVFAVVSDKEYREMAEILCREFMPDVLILTQIEYGRGLAIN